jgi:hypothetical protein
MSISLFEETSLILQSFRQIMFASLAFAQRLKRRFIKFLLNLIAKKTILFTSILQDLCL